MGWELRQGRWYLYRNRRVNGKPTKEYLAPQGNLGLLRAHELTNQQHRQRESRDERRKAAVIERATIDGITAAAGGGNQRIKVVVEGILVAFGFRNHHRGEWRMARGTTGLSILPEEPKVTSKKPSPLVIYEAPAGDMEAVELFAKARAGDSRAASAIRSLIIDRKWVESIGNISEQAAKQIVANATGGDLVWKAAIDEKMQALERELGGEGKSILEKLLIQRVLNGWLAVHLLEIRQSVRQPVEIKEREYLDRAVSRAQKRYTEAITALARIRRLKLPFVLARIDGITRPEGTGGAQPRKALAVQDS